MNKWYQDKQYITKQGEIILPENFGTLKFERINHHVQNVQNTPQPYLFFKKAPEEFLVAELLASHLANFLGISCVEVHKAIMVSPKQITTPGIVSEDFLNNRNTQKEVLANDIYSMLTRGLFDNLGSKRFVKKTLEPMVENESKTVEYQLKLIKLFADYLGARNPNKKIVISPHLESDLLDMVFFDYLVMNKDRHAKNVAYVVEKNKDNIVITLAKKFDHEYCFLLDSNRPFQEKLNDMENQPYHYFGVYQKNEGFGMKSVKEELAVCLATNSHLAAIYQKACALDTKQFVKNICQKEGVAIPQKYAILFSKVIANRLQNLKEEIKCLAQSTREKTNQTKKEKNFDRCE